MGGELPEDARRESGLPTLVGVKHVTKLTQDSDTININGAAGEIHIHPEANR